MEEPRPEGPPGEHAPLEMQCISCRWPLKLNVHFCAHCGHRVGDPAPSRPDREGFTRFQSRVQREWMHIRSVIIFYVFLLGVQIVSSIVARSSEAEFAAILTGDILMGAITVFYALWNGDVVQSLYLTPGFRVRGYLLVLLGSVPFFLFVFFFVYAMQKGFGVPDEKYIDWFGDRSFAWVILLMCVTPAVFEELAFRGIVFGVLRKYVGVAEALIISSVAFAILHLSVLSLVTHIPMGMYFCFLRHKSGSMYPAMLAHFLHNFLVVMNEQFEVLT